MIRVFIGFDSAESVAYHVLAHSIITRSSQPVAITPIGNEVLPDNLWKRPRGKHDSTEFSNARFMVPELCDFEGWAIFMDCDMLCQADLAELWEQRDPQYAVQVRKHSHRVRPGETKFLGAEQSAYSRKNWSSLMLMNCEHESWQYLDPNIDPGLDLHQFSLLGDKDIGAIEGTWNQLLVPGEESVTAKLWHFTLGGPWHGWVNYEPAWGWCAEFSDMLGGNNPRALINSTLAQNGVTVGGSYFVSSADAQAQETALKKSA